MTFCWWCCCFFFLLTQLLLFFSLGFLFNMNDFLLSNSLILQLVCNPPIKEKNSTKKKKDKASFYTAVRQLLVCQVLPNSIKKRGKKTCQHMLRFKPLPHQTCVLTPINTLFRLQTHFSGLVLQMSALPACTMGGIVQPVKTS